MSADNWAICPQCTSKLKAGHEKLTSRAKASYGKVSPEKYAELIEAVKFEPPASSTLREDYEIGVDRNGLFYINYGCSCSACGFSFSFKHEEQTK